MAPFSIPAPSIIPLRLPIFGGPKSIDTDTKIQLLCETFLEHEIFYTIDGTKPQPYAGIVQGNRTIKYTSPFCLSPGKIPIKAIALNANIHTMCSSIVTKYFEVLRAEGYSSAKKKTPSRSKENCSPGYKISKCLEGTCVKNKLNSKTIDCNQNSIACLENAFILDTIDVEVQNNISGQAVDEVDLNSVGVFDLDVSEESISMEDSEIRQSTQVSGIADFESLNVNDASSFESLERSCENYTGEQSGYASDALSNTNCGQSVETQFCCMKCDITLQQCLSCNRMNAVSSKFCISCGTQLVQICSKCNQHNSSIASFCQFCGRKLVNAATKLEFSSMVDNSVMVKPKSKNASIQKFPCSADKGTQTHLDKTYTKKSSPKTERKKDLPPRSPGRGYWRLQLDYICNHLKTHAYNNLEFRKVISEPSLCQFKSAHVTRDDENVTVTVVFSPLSHKCNSSDSGDSKAKDSS